MSAIIEAIGAVISKVCQYIPGRIEGLKNKKTKLEKEKKSLESITMDIDSPEDRKKAKRLADINSQLNDIERLLENKTSDN